MEENPRDDEPDLTKMGQMFWKNLWDPHHWSTTPSSPSSVDEEGGPAFCDYDQHEPPSPSVTSDSLRFQEAVKTLLLLDEEDRTFPSDAPPTQIPQIQQTERWDCGVACIQMILRWLRRGELENGHLSMKEVSERSWMLETLGTQSIWSIDLVSLLQQLLNEKDDLYDTRYLLCSKTLGVDPSHHALGFYQKSFSADEERVKSLFETAQSCGWPLLCFRHLELAQAIRIVSHPECVAIVLLDNTILRTQQQSSASFAGHYVVLCGISHDASHVANALRHEAEAHSAPEPDFCMVVTNPASRQDIDFIAPNRFERAWRAKGTDDDILFIRKCLF